MSGSAFAVTHHAFSSGAGRTSDGNGSHASTLKSPSYTKSVSWQHYRAVNYRYVLDGRLLSEYPMEQQAQIIADHFTLQAEGYGTWCDMRRDGDITLDGNMSEYVIRSLYTSTLRGFPW